MINSASSQSLYASLPNVVLGFHGCDQSVYEKILYSHKPFKSSMNSYDWLGHGMYFWEQNFERAWEWAREGADRSQSKIHTPAVIGAVIDLGFCLNLLDSQYIHLLQDQYDIFCAEMELAGKPIPKNKDLDSNTDLRLRFLDCAVIESLHQERMKSKNTPIDSVRGVFFEGDPIYETSGFHEQSHIQICVRNPNCIKGFFAPMRVNGSWRIP